MKRKWLDFHKLDTLVVVILIVMSNKELRYLEGAEYFQCG